MKKKKNVYLYKYFCRQTFLAGRILLFEEKFFNNFNENCVQVFYFRLYTYEKDIKTYEII